MSVPVLKNYRGYLGNDNIKRAGVKVEWTPEQSLEILKCKRDPVYFAEKYMRIVNADGDVIPFELYDYQKEIIRSLHESRRMILLQARQSGKCQYINTSIRVKNKITGKIVETTIGEFHDAHSKNKILQKL